MSDSGSPSQLPAPGQRRSQRGSQRSGKPWKTSVPECHVGSLIAPESVPQVHRNMNLALCGWLLCVSSAKEVVGEFRGGSDRPHLDGLTFSQGHEAIPRQ